MGRHSVSHIAAQQGLSSRSTGVGAAKYVGRVGALALAMGVGAALAGGAGLANADGTTDNGPELRWRRRCAGVARPDRRYGRAAGRRFVPERIGWCQDAQAELADPAKDGAQQRRRPADEAPFRPSRARRCRTGFATRIDCRDSATARGTGQRRRYGGERTGTRAHGTPGPAGARAHRTPGQSARECPADRRHEGFVVDHRRRRGFVRPRKDGGPRRGIPWRCRTSGCGATAPGHG